MTTTIRIEAVDEETGQRRTWRFRTDAESDCIEDRNDEIGRTDMLLRGLIFEGGTVNIPAEGEGL